MSTRASAMRWSRRSDKYGTSGDISGAHRVPPGVVIRKALTWRRRTWEEIKHPTCHQGKMAKVSLLPGTVVFRRESSMLRNLKEKEGNVRSTSLKKNVLGDPPKRPKDKNTLKCVETKKEKTNVFLEKRSTIKWFTIFQQNYQKYCVFAVTAWKIPSLSVRQNPHFSGSGSQGVHAPKISAKHLAKNGFSLFCVFCPSRERNENEQSSARRWPLLVSSHE